MTLFYSPSFTGECYRNLPVNETQFEKVIGDAGLLDFLELHLGLAAHENAAIERILSYQTALESCKKEAFYEKAFDNDPLATAKEILRWRDIIVMEGFNPDADYNSPRLRKLAEVERTFSKAGLVGTPERWKQVLLFSNGIIPGVEIIVRHDFKLLPKLIRESLKAIGAAKGEYDGLGEKSLSLDTQGKDITIRYFGTVAEAFLWAADNHRDFDGAVICPDPFRMNAVLKNRERPLLEAYASGNSSITQLLRLGLSILERPLNINNLLEYLRTGFSPIPGKIRYALAEALLRDGGRGGKWKKILSECGDDQNVKDFLLALLDADIENGKVQASVVTKWCEDLVEWSSKVITKERKAYQLELISLCDGMCRVIENMPSDLVEVKVLLKALKTLYASTPVKTDGAMANSWNVVDSHRCMIDAPESLLWLPCNGGLETSYPYSFLLQEEVEELKLNSNTAYIRYDFNLLVDLLGNVKTIELCACDFDRSDALSEHPAVTLCKPKDLNDKKGKKEIDMRSAKGGFTPSIFNPLRTLETGVDLYPRRKENGKETEEDIALSATSIETLIAFPFDFVLDKKLRFKDVSSLQLSDLTPTQGTVAHYIFECMLKNSGGDIRQMRAMLDEKSFNERVDNAAKEKGEILFMPENRTLLAHFKRTVRKSIGVLLDILEESKLRPKDSEVNLNEDLENLSSIVGSVDFYAERQNGDLVVIDFKYSGGKAYIEKLEDDKSIQLEVYTKALEKMFNRKVTARGYYFFPINQLHTDDDTGVFRGNGVIRHKKKEKDVPLAERIRNSVEQRRSELKQGSLEMEEGAPLDEINYHIKAEDGSLIDLPADKGKVKASSPFSKPTKYPILKDSIK